MEDGASVRAVASNPTGEAGKAAGGRMGKLILAAATGRARDSYRQAQMVMNILLAPRMGSGRKL